MTLSGQQKYDYLADKREGDEACPHCHSRNLTIKSCDRIQGDMDDPPWADSLRAHRQCDDCHQEWYEVYCYRIIDIEDCDSATIGVVLDDAVVCLPCGQFSEGDDATRDGYPDGFTCADCGTIVT